MQAPTSLLRANQRHRTRRDLLAAANELIEQGKIPTVAEVAEAASVSRATGYRYFPTQSALIEGLIQDIDVPAPAYEAQGREPADVAARIDAYVDQLAAHMETVEPQLRAALRLSLEQWGRARSGSTEHEAPIRRGRRIELIEAATAPLRERLDEGTARRLTMALSVLLGIEALVVLKDLWGLSGPEAREIVRWSARAITRAAAEGAPVS